MGGPGSTEPRRLTAHPAQRQERGIGSAGRRPDPGTGRMENSLVHRLPESARLVGSLGPCLAAVAPNILG